MLIKTKNSIINTDNVKYIYISTHCNGKYEVTLNADSIIIQETKDFYSQTFPILEALLDLILYCIARGDKVFEVDYYVKQIRGL